METNILHTLCLGKNKNKNTTMQKPSMSDHKVKHENLKTGPHFWLHDLVGPVGWWVFTKLWTFYLTVKK